MAARDEGEIALSGETANTLAKRLAGRQAARLSLVPEENPTVQGKARVRKGPVPRTGQKTVQHVQGVWYVLKAKRGDGAQMGKVLRAAAEAARRTGTAHALELLGGPGARPWTRAPRESPASAPSDYRVHEARRWAEAQADFLAAHESVTAPELARLTGSKSANPSARAHSWVKANRIFSVNDGTAERYPLFQLREGRPLPQLADILPVLKQKLSNWQNALWFTAPNAWVGGWRRPVDVLTENPDVVLDAAQHEVGEHVL